MRLSLSQKAEMVRLLRLGASADEMQSQFCCSKRSVYRFKKAGDRILADASGRHSLRARALMKHLKDNDDEVTEGILKDAMIDPEQMLEYPTDLEQSFEFQEDVRNGSKEITSLMEIAEKFLEAEMYVESVGIAAAGDALRRAKRILFDTYDRKNKERKRYKLILGDVDAS